MPRAPAFWCRCACGWRNKKKPGVCECPPDRAKTCACVWGRCPRCKGRVYPVEEQEKHGVGLGPNQRRRVT